MDDIRYTYDNGDDADIRQELDAALDEANKQYDDNGEVVPKEVLEEQPVKDEVAEWTTPEGEVEKPKKELPSPKLIRELRIRDRKRINKTCSHCATRRPLDEMDGGKADVCVHCK